MDDDQSAELVAKNLAKFEVIIAKSDLSRQKQELLGSYLLFERYIISSIVRIQSLIV